MLLLCPLMHAEGRLVSKPGHPFRGMGFPVSRRQRARAIQTDSPANATCLWLTHVTPSNESPENLLAEEQCKKMCNGNVWDYRTFSSPSVRGKISTLM